MRKCEGEEVAVCICRLEYSMEASVSMQFLERFEPIGEGISLPPPHEVADDEQAEVVALNAMLALPRRERDIGFSDVQKTELIKRACRHIITPADIHPDDIRFNRLKKVLRESKAEPPIKRLDMISQGLDGLLVPVLSRAEVESAVGVLRKWDYATTSLTGGPYHVLHREFPDYEARPSVTAQTPSLATWTDSGFVIIGKKMTVDDMQLVLGIEKETRRTNFSDSDQEAARSIVNSLSSREKEAIEKIYKTDGEIAYEMGIDPSTVRSVWAKIVHKLGLENTHDIVALAILSGYANIYDVPKSLADAKFLTDPQKELLIGFHDKTYNQAANSMERSRHTIKQWWREIFVSLGVVSKRQAFIWGVRDGLIPLPLPNIEA